MQTLKSTSLDHPSLARVEFNTHEQDHIPALYVTITSLIMFNGRLLKPALEKSDKPLSWLSTPPSNQTKPDIKKNYNLLKRLVQPLSFICHLGNLGGLFGCYGIYRSYCKGIFWAFLLQMLRMLVIKHSKVLESSENILAWYMHYHDNKLCHIDCQSGISKITLTYEAGMWSRSTLPTDCWKEL